MKCAPNSPRVSGGARRDRTREVTYSGAALFLSVPKTCSAAAANRLRSLEACASLRRVRSVKSPGLHGARRRAAGRALAFESLRECALPPRSFARRMRRCSRLATLDLLTREPTSTSPPTISSICSSPVATSCLPTLADGRVFLRRRDPSWLHYSSAGAEMAVLAACRVREDLKPA